MSFFLGQVEYNSIDEELKRLEASFRLLIRFYHHRSVRWGAKTHFLNYDVAQKGECDNKQNNIGCFASDWFDQFFWSLWSNEQADRDTKDNHTDFTRNSFLKNISSEEMVKYIPPENLFVTFFSGSSISLNKKSIKSKKILLR